jgi:hypothetical protein
VLLSKGLWLGKGRIRPSGISLGDEVEADVQVSEDDEGISLSGAFSGAFNGTFSIRIAPDETGTYVVDARVGAFALEGMGKLESEPNLCLLWNEGGTQSATVALFAVARGIGCRGFLREGEQTLTWEMLLRLKQDALKADNVVSLSRRRR